MIKSKQKLRERILKLLRNHKEDDRLEKSLIIQKKLLRMREYKKAKAILFYASFDGEVETLEMIKESLKLGKKISLPRIQQKIRQIIPTFIRYLHRDLQTGPYGIKQPKFSKANEVSVNDLDLVIVPGLAFDKNNFRLGRGAGYYDRFLDSLPPGVPTIGLAFDFQMVNKIPQIRKHDVPVTHVLTNYSSTQKK